MTWIKVCLAPVDHSAGEALAAVADFMAMDKTTALLRVPAFCGLPRPLIDRLAEGAGIQRLGKGSTLFREGERAHFVYALIEGKISLLSGFENTETIADFVDVGEIVLISPALLGLPYMVTAKAVTDLLVIMIPVDLFRHMAETELPLAVALNRVLASHWRLLLRQLTQTKSQDADSRLIQYLIGEAGATEGAVQFALPGSKRALAAHLGITPETLSRSLKRLGSLGVKSKGCEILIENVSRLSNRFERPNRTATNQAMIGVTQ